MDFIESHFKDMQSIIEGIDKAAIFNAISLLKNLRDRSGRLFIVGVGGSAANASHAVNDFRKLANIESYAPSDNVAELTARANDDGWETIFSNWLLGSRMTAKDALLVLSVGGGNVEKGISVNIVNALKLTNQLGAESISIVGRNDGFAAQNTTVPIVIPAINPEFVTPHSESFQAVVWHLMVSHPTLKHQETKWESLEK
jgi:D-sedoheptulose 7-phosphate isomerase